MNTKVALVSIALVTAATATAMSTTTPASAAGQATARYIQSVQAPPGWTKWAHFSRLDYCLAAGEAGKEAGRWKDWACYYPPAGYDLWVLLP